MRRRALLLILAAAFGGATVGADSCEDATKDLEDISGENDSQYKAKMRQVQLGMSKKEVRGLLGAPHDKQVFRSESGRDESWYYGTWQLNFENGNLRSKNRY